MSKNLAPKNAVFYRNQNWYYPKIVRGEGIYLYDEEGNAYLDGCSGSAVANLGHGNKEIAAYTKKQMETIAFTHLSRWTAEPIEACAQRIVSHAPDNLNHVYFVSGGSEAVETAIKVARQYFVERDGHNATKWKVISKWHSYHGNTIGALSATGIKSRRKPYLPYLLDFPKIEQFYHYRNPWNTPTLYETSVKAAEQLEIAIKKVGASQIAAFISEPVVGSAAPGVHPDPIYFKMIRDICDRYDILFICDEVMSGFGRTGKWFASEHFGAKPDIIATAKGMSCGYTPFGAAIVSDTIFNQVMIDGSGSFVHGHTYAGNPLSCGIANKVLQIIERDGLIPHAEQMGTLLMDKLKNLASLQSVGEIRGKGLMIGIEFVQDKATKAPFDPSLSYKNIVMQACLAEKLVVYPGGGSVDGIKGDHILLAPPINITEAEINALYQRLEKGLIQAERKIAWKN